MCSETKRFDMTGDLCTYHVMPKNPAGVSASLFFVLPLRRKHKQLALELSELSHVS